EPVGFAVCGAGEDERVRGVGGEVSGLEGGCDERHGFVCADLGCDVGRDDGHREPAFYEVLDLAGGHGASPNDERRPDRRQQFEHDTHSSTSQSASTSASSEGSAASWSTRPKCSITAFDVCSPMLTSRAEAGSSRPPSASWR